MVVHLSVTWMQDHATDHNSMWQLMFSHRPSNKVLHWYYFLCKNRMHNTLGFEKGECINHSMKKCSRVHLLFLISQLPVDTNDRQCLWQFLLIHIYWLSFSSFFLSPFLFMSSRDWTLHVISWYLWEHVERTSHFSDKEWSRLWL